MINTDHIYAGDSRGGTAPRVRRLRRAAVLPSAVLAAFVLVVAACAADPPPPAADTPPVTAAAAVTATTTVEPEARPAATTAKAPAVDPQPEPESPADPEPEPLAEPADTTAEPEAPAAPEPAEPEAPAAPEPAEPEPEPEPDPEPEPAADTPPVPPAPSLTITVRPAPATTTTTTTAAPTTTTTTTPTPPARVAEPLEQCASDVGWHGAGRVSVYAGTTADGFYEPVVEGGADSCEQIKAWWDQITQAEAQRIAEGQYPCEHGAAYNYRRDESINGPALLAGCWPRLLYAVGEQYRLADPDEEADRLRHLEGSHILPPNHPALVKALYGCYSDALQGPPAGWTPATPSGEWVTPPFCHAVLGTLGTPVRYMGVTPECAAGMFAGQIQERKARGWVADDDDQYAGEYSWANCDTHADRLLAETQRALPFTERCEAVIDGSAAAYDTRAADTAASHDLPLAEYLAEIKAMYCEGTADNLRGYPQFKGGWVESWLPLEGTICWESALLAAARTAAYGRWTRVTRC